jgi:DNA-binding FrmR family transcriptional regulator
MFERLVRVRGQLKALVTAVDPDAVSGDTARQLWAEFDQVERLAAAGKTLLARRVAQTHQRAGGTRSAAEELSRRSGTSTGAAKDTVDTSARLPEQPTVQGALRRGGLSAAQAALISAAVAADPGQAGRLTELAPRVSLAELREECARIRAAADPDPEATHRRIHAARRLRHYTDTEGGWNLSARGTAQAGAAFLTVLNTLTDRIFTTARRDGRREPPAAYGFDALMTLADHTTGHDGGHGGAGEPEQAGHNEQATGAGSRATAVHTTAPIQTPNVTSRTPPTPPNLPG